jgi:integrase/recombinase XerD
MSRRKSIPDPIIVSLEPASKGSDTAHSTEPSEAIESRQSLVEEFLQGRSLAPRSQKAYRQDLQHFLNWTDKRWVEITPRHIVQFKAHLQRKDFQSGQPAISDATVRRVLGTLKNFYRWMVRSHYISIDPTLDIELPKLPQSEAQILRDDEVAQIYRAVATSSLPERNIALISVLLHGLRAEEVSALNVEDYDGQRVRILPTSLDNSDYVPLTIQGRIDLEQYLQWRQEAGERLSPQSPLFTSHSRRNRGERLGYDGIRKLIDQVSKRTKIDLHTHQFRQTFTKNLVLKGMNPYHAMMLTRHRSIQSFQRYAKTIDQAAVEAEFNEIMGNSGSKHLLF